MPTTLFDRISIMPLEIKQADASQLEFWGFASTPQVDRVGEVVTSEAMSEAAGRYLQNPLITWMHDMRTPIGKALEVDVTETGTTLHAKLSDRTQAGRDAWGLIEDGVVRSLSIGFNPYSRALGPSPDGVPDWEDDPDTDVRRWLRIDWLETAVVSVPANPGATIAFAKGLGLDMDTERRSVGVTEPLWKSELAACDTWDAVAMFALRASGAGKGLEVTSEDVASLVAEVSAAYAAHGKTLPGDFGAKLDWRAIEWQEGEVALMEERRFAEDLGRVKSATESLRNIGLHWRKDGHVLVPETVAELEAARDNLGKLLEPYPAGEAVTQPDGALSVPTMQLPRKPKLRI